MFNVNKYVTIPLKKNKLKKDNKNPVIKSYILSSEIKTLKK